MNVFYLGAPMVIPLNLDAIVFTSDFVFLSVTVSQ